MTLSTPCRCGHHRLTHTYTQGANVGRCLGKSETCECAEYEPEEGK